MKKFTEQITNMPYLTLGLIILLTAFFAFGTTKLYTQNNQDSELPESDEIVRTNKELEEVFGEKDIIMVSLLVKEGTIYNPQTMGKVLQIVEELKQIEGVIPDEILSLPTFNHIEGVEWGLEVGEYIDKQKATDPAFLSKVEKDVKSNSLINGILVSKKGDFLNIIANISEGYKEEVVFAKLEAIKARYEGPEQIFLAGDPVSQKEIDIGIKEDLGILLPLALVIMLLGFWICFRSLYGVLLPATVVILSIVWTMGTMGWLGLPVTVISSVVPILMIAVSSSYGIHVMYRYYEERSHSEGRAAVAGMLNHIGPAILMTGFTSSVSALTLIVFKVSSIRDFGIIAGIGIIHIVVISLLLIPAILSIRPPKTLLANTEKKGLMDRFLSKLAKLSIQSKPAILTVSFIVILVATYGLTQIKIGNDFIKYFPDDHRLRQTFDIYNDKLGGVRYIDIMFNGGSQDALKDPENLQDIENFKVYAESLDGVGYVTSFTDVIKRINKEVHAGNPAFEVIPSSSNEIAQYLLLFSMSGSSGDIDELVDEDFQRAKIRMMLTTSEQDDHTAIYNNLKNYAANEFKEGASLSFGGDVMFWLSQIKYIVKGKIENIILAIVIITIFCMAVFRSFRYGLLSAVPMIFSSIVTFGLMGLLGIRLEIGTSVITAMGIGIGIDFAIHFIMRYRQELQKQNSEEEAIHITMATAGKAIFFDVFSNIIGFMVFVFSGFLPVQNFGWLISFTMITVAFGSVLLMPALIGTVYKSTAIAPDAPFRKKLSTQIAKVK